MLKEEAWLLGLIVGDGHVSRYFVEISDRFYENLAFTKDIISQLGFKSKITKDKKENRYRLRITSKKFVKKLQELGYKDNFTIPRLILQSRDKDIVHSFVRGLYDAEGYIEKWKPRNIIRINFSNKSLKIVEFVLKVLGAINIKTYFRYSCRAYRIQIYRKRDVEKFLGNIGFWYPKKLERLKIPRPLKAEG